jgi:hypothetical protein
VNLENLAIVAVVLSMASSLTLLISRSWRVSILALAVQYMAAFGFIAMLWPVPMAVVKLVVGWMTAAVLGSSQGVEEAAPETALDISSRLFRILAAVMAWLLVFSIAPALSVWLPTGMAVLYGGLVLTVMGLLQLGMTTRPARVILGLLTVLSGFEVLYAVVETSVLVTGLLSIINLGVALAGSYLLSASRGDEML